ncbi:RICIN domain-containing protein [Streptomyces sp. NPDC005811]|uniref:RICIN domain-containing protein n=1 Tax=Streptomyces sp. NPDC005811 TaxID=3154565 RepID=UPI00340DDBE0
MRADEESGEDPTASDDSDASDARLTNLLRGAPAGAYPALRALRTRHEPAVLAYARLCTTSEPAARRLAAEAFTRTARETARGSEPGGAWRHRLLLQVGRVAAEWAGDDRASGLDAGLLLVLRTAPAPHAPLPPLSPAFHSLPPRTQGLLWYGVVERESPTRIAVLLGLTPEDVSYGIAPALHALAGAALRLRLAASDDPSCGDFRRLIEESVRPEGARRSPDLEAHRARCPHCATAYEEQRALRDAPRTALAEGLLPWAGTAYVREEREPAREATAPVRRLPRRRVLLGSTVAALALIPLWLTLMPSDDAGAPTGPAAAAPSTAPQVTVTTTVSAPPPSPTPSTKPPTPSPTPSPSRTTPTPSPSPTPTRAPGGTYAQVVNVATGRCLEVAGDFDNGTDVVTVPCSASPSQRWRVDAGRGVVQSAADTDFCLDSRGSVDKGVGVWQCASVEGDNGDNLRFTVDTDGTIRPRIAILTGLTADPEGGVSLEPLDEAGDQRWRAGSR